MNGLYSKQFSLDLRKHIKSNIKARRHLISV